MKPFTYFKYVACFMAVALVVACVDEPLFVETETVVAENPDYEIIRSMGWQTDGIVERENHYIVEGDVLLERSWIDSLRLGLVLATRQSRYADGILTGGRQDGLRIKIVSRHVPDFEWRQAVLQAINIWNSVPNCSVHLRGIEMQLYSGDITVYGDDATLLPWTVVAGALPPRDGKARDIFINPTYNFLTQEEKIYVMVHELGHTLGLGHTDVVDPNNPSLHISGTPQQDYQSVMHSDREGRERGDASNWRGFTPGDLAAIQALYGDPIWSQEIAGPAVWWRELNTPIFVLLLGSNLTGIDIDWYINGTLRQSDSSCSFAPWQQPLPSGTAILKAVVNYGGRSYEATKHVNFSDPTISGPDEPRYDIYESYSVPTILPEGVSFSGWSVASGGNYITAGLNQPNLSIKFTNRGQYTLTAGFDLPGGGQKRISKTITVASMNPPVITVNNPSGRIDQNGDHIFDQGSYDRYSFSIDFPENWVDYEWYCSHPNWVYSDPYDPGYFGNHLYVNHRMPHPTGRDYVDGLVPYWETMTVRCRGRNCQTGDYSEWSDWLNVRVEWPLVPRYYSTGADSLAVD